MCSNQIYDQLNRKREILIPAYIVLLSSSITTFPKSSANIGLSILTGYKLIYTVIGILFFSVQQYYIWEMHVCFFHVAIINTFPIVYFPSHPIKNKTHIEIFCSKLTPPKRWSRKYLLTYEKAKNPNIKYTLREVMVEFTPQLFLDFLLEPN